MAPAAIARAQRSANNHWNPPDGDSGVGNGTPGICRFGPPPWLGDWPPVAFSLATPPVGSAGLDTSPEGNAAGDEAAAAPGAGAPGAGRVVSLASRR